ncbi:hypothetical protein HPG69_017244, partial [Diceros bicornis minor]
LAPLSTLSQQGNARCLRPPPAWLRGGGGGQRARPERGIGEATFVLFERRGSEVRGRTALPSHYATAFFITVAKLSWFKETLPGRAASLPSRVSLPGSADLLLRCGEAGLTVDSSGGHTEELCAWIPAVNEICNEETDVVSAGACLSLHIIVVAFAELIAFMSADWLIGKAKTAGSAEPAEQGSPGPHHPTLGIYARCIRNPGVQHVPRETLCGPYAESFGEIASGFWQATAIFLATGIFILCTVALVSVFTMCVQSIMKKSIFNVCGLLQGIAGKCRGEGWGSRVCARSLIGPFTAPFGKTLCRRVSFARHCSRRHERAALGLPAPCFPQP